MKIDEISAWEAFQGVATHGNFSKAAKALRIGVPQLSKRVARLEDLLGVRLFARSTRVVMLTEEGKALLPKVNTLLDDLTGIEASFEESQELSGTVRVTCVSSMARGLLIPVLTRFAKLHPKVHVEVDLSERLESLVESGYDVAIRIHDEPEDSTLVYRKLIPNRLILCASPKYLKSTSLPIKRPADLREHPLMMFSAVEECRFKDGSYRLVDLAKKKRITCDTGWFLTELALSGAGVLVRSITDVRDHLKKGTLIQVLENYPVEAFGDVYAVTSSRRYLAPRVRAFLDFLAECATEWK